MDFMNAFSLTELSEYIKLEKKKKIKVALGVEPLFFITFRTLMLSRSKAVLMSVICFPERMHTWAS